MCLSESSTRTFQRCGDTFCLREPHQEQPWASDGRHPASCPWWRGHSELLPQSPWGARGLGPVPPSHSVASSLSPSSHFQPALPSQLPGTTPLAPGHALGRSTGRLAHWALSASQRRNTFKPRLTLGAQIFPGALSPSSWSPDGLTTFLKDLHWQLWDSPPFTEAVAPGDPPDPLFTPQPPHPSHLGYRVQRTAGGQARAPLYRPLEIPRAFMENKQYRSSSKN